jgi:hypothetical protein
MMVPSEPTVQAAMQQLSTRLARLLRSHERATPRRARALVRGASTDGGVTRYAADAALVASELVTSAVEHAATARWLLEFRAVHGGLERAKCCP